MNWSELGKKVADFAPLLGSAIGGPAGASIGAIVASKLGTKNEPIAISDAIKADPQAAMKLREVEITNETKLIEIVLADKQNARRTHKDSEMPAVLSVSLTVMIAAIFYLLFFIEIPAGAKEVLLMLLGVVVKEWGGSMQYWFGTTHSSNEKNKLFAR